MSCQLGWAAHSEAPDAASNGAGATTRTTTVTRCTEEPLKDRRGRADIYGRNKTTALHPAISAGVLPLSWGWLWLRGAGGRSFTGKPVSKSVNFPCTIYINTNKALLSEYKQLQSYRNVQPNITL